MKDVTARLPRLVVLAADSADVVSGVGGLVIDRVRLGWQVTVLVAEHADPRPLHILGVGTADIGAHSDVADAPHSALLAPAALYARDAEVRSAVRAALATKTTEVLLWGQSDDRDGTAVSYRLSAAARAFKSQALLAAGLSPARIEPVETYRTSCALDVLARELDVAG